MATTLMKEEEPLSKTQGMQFTKRAVVNNLSKGSLRP
jgi:hypothetical protein